MKASDGEAKPGMVNKDRPSVGIALMLVATFIFASQDAMTKIVSQTMATPQILMVRYLLVLVYALFLFRLNGRPIRRCLESHRPYLQVLRSIIIAVEIGIFVLAIRHLSMSEVHSLMATFPLMVTALSVPFLGEDVGLRRWTAVGIGFLGVLIILRPGMGVFGWPAVLALICAFLFALYHVLTRLVSRNDKGDTSFFYMALVGCAMFTALGPFFWRMPSPLEWMLLIAIALTASVSHMLLIKALENAPASVLQPFNYMLLVWATLIGFLVFDSLPDVWTIVGASVVVGSGLYTIYRERIRKAPDGSGPGQTG